MGTRTWKLQGPEKLEDVPGKIAVGPHKSFILGDYEKFGLAVQFPSSSIRYKYHKELLFMKIIEGKRSAYLLFD